MAWRETAWHGMAWHGVPWRRRPFRVLAHPYPRSGHAVGDEACLKKKNRSAKRKLGTIFLMTDDADVIANATRDGAKYGVKFVNVPSRCPYLVLALQYRSPSLLLNIPVPPACCLTYSSPKPGCLTYRSPKPTA